MKKSLFLLSLSASMLLAGGYKVPEQSIKGTGLAAANVAAANGADAAYYNPANMVFNKGSSLELDVTYIGLGGIDFDGSVTTSLTGEVDATGYQSKSEQFFIPTIHYVSEDFNGYRFGLSVVLPGGLTKRWDERMAKALAEEFTLETVEINPSVAYKISNNVAFAFGLRGLYSRGNVKTDFDSMLTFDVSGDSMDFGYNAALSYQKEAFKCALTYRSKIDLSLEGDAELYYSDGTTMLSYDDDGSVDIPIPAAWNIAVAYDVTPSTTVEFLYEYTEWSAYKYLDFEYDESFETELAPGVMHPFYVFDAKVYKGWKDTNSYRIGITHRYSDTLTFLAGYAYDETPTNEKKLGFDLPDSDFNIYSAGMLYRYDKEWTLGASVLLTEQASRTVSETNDNGIQGTFSNISAVIVTTGIEYNF